MSFVRGLAAVLAFTLELGMLAALAYWALNATASTALGIGLAVLADGAAIAVWGAVLAPRAARRLPWPWRVVGEIAVLGVSAVVLWAAGQPGVAAVYTWAIAARFLLGWVSGADRLEVAA